MLECILVNVMYFVELVAIVNKLGREDVVGHLFRFALGRSIGSARVSCCLGNHETHLDIINISNDSILLVPTSDRGHLTNRGCLFLGCLSLQ